MKKPAKSRLIAALTIVAILAGAVIIAQLFINTKPEVRKRPSNATTISLKGFKEQPGTFPISLNYPGRVVSQDVVALGVEVGGKIERGAIPLKEGETFTKGELLFSINRDDINSRLISAKSKFLTTLSQVLPDIKYDMPNEYQKWESYFNSIDLNKLTPELPAIGSNKERVYIAANNIISQYYDIHTQEIELSKHDIYAPFDGVFTDVSKEVGAIVSQNAQIGVITSTKHLEVKAAVVIDEVSRISEGSEAIVSARTGEKVTGKISRISSYVDSRTQMVDVYVHIDNKEGKLFEGEMVDVSLSAGNLEGVIEIPNEALAQDNVIYVIDSESKLQSKKVTVEFELGDWVYISGITGNDIVVQESIITPIIGSTITVINQHISKDNE